MLWVHAPDLQLVRPAGPGRKLTDVTARLYKDLYESRSTLYWGTLSEQQMSARDAHARACPGSATRSIPELASYLASGARTAEEKVRSIVFWLHLNMSYDTASFFSGNIRSMGMEDVLRTRYVCALHNGSAAHVVVQACYHFMPSADLRGETFKERPFSVDTAQCRIGAPFRVML